jgi:sugar O-acyltransferase (sialic acid O-acetyltransferase NeuD family)
MKNIIIIGAGGFGREIYSYIQDDIHKGFLKNCTFKGFVDDDEINFKNLKIKEEKWLGTIDEYKYLENDFVIIAIGSIKARNSIISKLNYKKVNFYSYIHNSVFVAADAIVNDGIIICPNSMIQSNALVEQYCILNIFTSIGHDSVLGKGSILSPYCTLNGNVHTGNNLFMGTHSSILLKSNIGSNCSIAAHTVVNGNIVDSMLVKDMKTQKQVKNRLI